MTNLNEKDTKLVKAFLVFSPIIVYILLKMFNASYAISFIVISLWLCVIALLVALNVAV